MTPTSGDPGLRVIYFQSAGTDPYRILATSIRVPVCQTRIMMIPRILPLALTLLAPMAALAQASGLPATVLHGPDDGRGAPVCIGCHTKRTYSGRPSSSMRFRTLTARAISVPRRRSVRERSPFPITRLNRLMSASTRARQ